jgi:murein DD-endopeptidase MepM/ murein hydrolase activator NlpD
VYLRSLDLPVTQSSLCVPRTLIAAGLSVLILTLGPFARASADELGSSQALISTELLAAGPLQAASPEATDEETPVVEQTAPLDGVAEALAPTVEAAPPPAAVETPASPAPTAAPTVKAAAAPASTPTRPQFGVGKYTVARGDTMFSIAKKVGLSLGILSAANNISDPDAVKAGQTLYIPAQLGSVHVVSTGETVQSIAEKYKTKPESVREANRLDRDAKLAAGQLVLVPGVIPASATAMKPATPSPQSVSAASAISPLPAPKSAQTAAAPSAIAPVARAPQSAGGDTLIWPVIGPLSTNFSPAHRGLDVVANQGVPVKAALPGRVIGAAEGDGPYGWFVMVEHGGSFNTVYAHLSKIRVKVGDIVQKNQIVGEVGSTGQSTGAHLHFELRQGNVPIDPRPYLP